MWHEDTGVVLVPSVGDFVPRWASDVSADGTTIVGSSSHIEGQRVIQQQAFRWTATEGTTILGTLTNNLGRDYGHLSAVSANGHYAAGESSGQILYWTELERDRIFGLGQYVHGDGIGVEDISDDGNIIVGSYEHSDDHDRAMIWTADLGEPVDLADYLTSLGADLQGWQLRRATAISGDGRTIVGNGNSPEGGRRSWIAIVPEPSGFAMLLSAIGILSVFRNRKTCIQSDRTV